MDCDTHSNDFDRCLFHQATDDDHDLDQNGVFTKKGAVRIYSVPQHQWGPRCLSIRLQSSSTITVSVRGSIINNLTDLNTTEVYYYNEILDGSDDKIMNLLVKVFIQINYILAKIETYSMYIFIYSSSTFILL